MANFLKSKRGVAISASLLLILSLFSIFYFKLNIGPFFNDSNVLLIQLDHEVSTDNVVGELRSFSKPSRVEKESTSKFYAFYQGVSEDEKISILDTVSTKLPGIVSKTFYEYIPAKEVIVLQRALIVFAVFFVTALVYLALILRKNGLLIKDLLSFVIKELLMTLFTIIVFLGFGSVIGAVGVVMEQTFFTITLTGIFLIVIFEMYYVFRFKQLLQIEVKKSLQEISLKISKDYWPEFVFLLSMILIILVLPWIVISGELTLSIFQIVFAMLLIAYNFFVLRDYLLPFDFFTHKKFKFNKFLQKKW